MGKRFLTFVLSFVLILTIGFPVMQVGQVKAANKGNTITRAEWLHNLAETFEMTVEDENYPDNYFSDVDSSHEYYYDILLAVQFGLVNVEAGDPVYPDEPITRAFASETLNYCLGYQLNERSSYTFSDSSAVENKDAAQIAVNRGWFSLINGAFCPVTNVTAAEVSTMLEDAKAVWASTDVDVNHNNTYSFVDGIIDITQATGTYILDDGRIYISEYPENIVAGNQFAVEINGIPCVYLATNVEKEGEAFIVTGTEVDHDKAYDSIDIQGTVDAGALQIGEAAEGLKAEYVESVENASSPSSLNDRARGSIDLNKKTKLSVSGKHKLGDGQSVSVKAEMKNAKIDYAVSLTGETFVKLHGDTSINASFSFDTMKAIGMDEITLIPAQVPGIGGLDLIMELSAGGKFTCQTKGYMAVGLSYSPGNGMRIIKSFNASSFNFTCEANASAGLKVRLGITGKLLPFNGYVYATAGGKAVLKHTSYQSGEPKSCSTFAAYLYASAGASASLKLGNNTGVLDKEYEIYGEKNSPLRVYHHYEDGMEVMSCSRGNDYKYYTKAGSNLWGSGWTGANGVYGYDSAGNSIAVYTYSVDSNNNATITKYNGNAAYVYIPEQIDGYTVTMIGENAFKNNGLREVVIPDSVLHIGKSTFEKCTDLRSIDFSDKLKTIGSYAFSGCSSLTGIDIPNTVTGIGTYTFYNCTALTDVRVSESMLDIPNRAFANCTSLNTIELPDAITSISIYAFYNCTALENVKLPKGLTDLGSRAFMNCTSLSKIKIPKKLDSCGFYEYEGLFPAYGGPFKGCTNLTDIEFEIGITKIPQALLYSCDGIVEITIPDTVISIEMYGLASCSNLKTVKGMQSVTSIGIFAFQGNTKLENIELSKRLELIGAGAFRNCNSLQELTVPKSLSYVGYDYSIVGVGVGKAGVFAGNTLKEMYFEEGCTSVPSRLCMDATSLEHIHFSKSMKRIGEYSFSGCSALQEIEFIDNIYDVDDYAFSNCVSVSALKLNNGLQYIGEGAFNNCESITSVVLPDTVISLGDRAFWNCKAMENILISKNLKSIGNTAFQSCYALNDVVIPDNITSIGNNCFRFCTSLSNIDIPYGVTSIGLSAFEGCTALVEITIPDSVTYIGSSCFSGCEILENVNLGMGLSTISVSAFQNCAELKKIIIPRYCEKIEANAFKENVNLSEVTIPLNVNSISSNAFSYPSKITIKGVANSYAESFANSDEYTFIPIDIKSTMLNFYRNELNFSRPRESKVLPLNILSWDSTSIITYTSEDEKIATVKNGVVTSQGYGSTKITAISDNGLKDVITVNVIPAEKDPGQNTETPSEEPDSSKKENLDFTFKTIDGNTVSSKSDAEKEVTMLIFGRTTCGNSKSVIAGLSKSTWIHNPKINTIFIEIDQASKEETKEFANQNGCDEIIFCYDDEANASQALWKYLKLIGISGSVTLPVTVLIDSENYIHKILTGYQSAGTIFNEINQFAKIEGSGSDEEMDMEKNLIIDGSENYDYAYQALKILNQIRSDAGESALEMDDELLETAMKRAAEISVFYSHTRPCGKSCFSIFRPSNSQSENIAILHKTPEDVMDSWKNSAGHYANMVKSEFKSVGIGCFEDTDGVRYWVQCFDDSEATDLNKSGKNTITYTISVLQSLIHFSTEDSFEIGCNSDEIEVNMRIKNINSEWNFCTPEISTSNFDYVSSNPEIANVDTNGIVKVNEVGTAVITASFKENPSMKVSMSITKEAHSYSDEIIAPTYTSQGYTQHTCTNCGEVYTDSYIPPLINLPDDTTKKDPDQEPDIAANTEFFYELNNDEKTITIIKCTSSDVNIEIPASIDGYTVTRIGANAFKNITSMKAVSFPESLTGIGDYAFAGCTSLTSVTLPNTNTSLGFMGRYLFKDCVSLESAVLSEGRRTITSGLFEGCSALHSVIIPNSVTTISTNAFASCSSLKTLNLPSSLSDIYENAFLNSGISSIKYAGTSTNWSKINISKIGNSTFLNATVTGSNGKTFSANKNKWSTGTSINTVVKPTVSKVKSFRAKAGKKKLKLSWRKMSGVAGYQIEISKTKYFFSSKSINVSKDKKTYTRKKLKAKKKYYVRIRAYKTYRDANGYMQKVYGSWTKITKKTK